MFLKLFCVFVVLVILTGIYFLLHAHLVKSIYPVPKNGSTELIAGGSIVTARSGSREARGIYIKKGDSLVVMFHGNGSVISDEEYIAKKFIGINCSLLLVEYAGYGISKEYKPSESKIYDDSIALIKSIVKQENYVNDKIIVLGYSIGTAVAIEMSVRGIGSKLILLSAFTSMDDMVAKHSHKIVASLLNTEKYNSLSKVNKISAKTLLIHGDRDNFVPFEMSQKLYKNIKNSRLIAVKSDQHGNIYYDITQPQWDDILNFALE